MIYKHGLGNSHTKQKNKNKTKQNKTKQKNKTKKKLVPSTLKNFYTFFSFDSY